jgi:uncharacterized protein YbaR (Trm112 family)
MLLDLAESLACPRCGPPRGLIVLVEQMNGRRITAGRLDCPACEARFPLSGGEIDFRESSSRETPLEEGAQSGLEAVHGSSSPEERAVVASALLGIREGRGLLVLGPGLERSAARIAELSGGCEVLQLEGRSSGSRMGEGVRDPGETAAGSVTCLRGTSGDAIPLLSSRALGVVLDRGRPRDIDEAARILSHGGRLVILRPGPAAASLEADARFELLARDERALVATVGGDS